jgi:hypothetical protein
MYKEIMLNREPYLRENTIVEKHVTDFVKAYVFALVIMSLIIIALTSERKSCLPCKRKNILPLTEQDIAR